MSTQRYISTSFWDDRWIQSLDPSEKLLYLYLLTNPLTNIAGVYKIENRRISFDTGFTPEIVETILEKFEKSKKVYRRGEYIIIPKWPKHQRWETSTKIKAGIEAILKELSPELLYFLKKIGYTYPIDTLSIPYTYPSNYSDLDSDLDTDTDLNLSAQSAQPEPIDPQSFPTACAVDQKEVIPVSNPDKTEITPVSRSPPKKRGIELTDWQKSLFQAAKACFETDEKTKAMMYSDKGSAQMHTENLKLFVVKCTGIAPGMTTDFMRNVLEHFKILTNGKLKNVAFTPRALITPWIWEAVISSLPKPDSESTARIRESIKEMFKK